MNRPEDWTELDDDQQFELAKEFVHLHRHRADRILQQALEIALLTEEEYTLIRSGEGRHIIRGALNIAIAQLSAEEYPPFSDIENTKLLLVYYSA